LTVGGVTVVNVELPVKYAEPLVVPVWAEASEAASKSAVPA
jgi:hypothetical protein